jgi:hypothetical protein
MKKLRLKMDVAGALLSSEQMKKVVGGYAGCKSGGCTLYVEYYGLSYTGNCGGKDGACYCQVNINGVPFSTNNGGTSCY